MRIALISQLCRHNTRARKWRLELQLNGIMGSMRTILENRAERMRREPTPAEKLLYMELLKAFAPYEASVHCQEPIGYYIADFMIYPFRLVVECDGSHHHTPKGLAYDGRRETAMRELGIFTLRFDNAEILTNPQRVIEQVLDFCGDGLMPKKENKGPQITYCPPASAIAGKKFKRRNWNKLRWEKP
jgi:very-short-patch-repair endonuclease